MSYLVKGRDKEEKDMTNKTLEAGQTLPQGKDAAGREKEIEYIYIFSPQENKPGFYALCLG